MKAIYYEKFGNPEEVLQLKDLPIPAPNSDEVLVKVSAASVNSWDWDLVRGRPLVFRFWGLFKPKYKIPGSDIAGVIEKVGANVSKFKPGDKVFGDLCTAGWGGFAEYVCANENSLSLIPDSMTFEDAASLPQAGVMALQGIKDYGKVVPGQKILINGAGGGVGTFAIQLAKSAGAEITAVDNAEKLQTMLDLGAGNVTDYRIENYTKSGIFYDVIIDNTAQYSISDYKKSLSPGGKFIMVGGSASTIFQIMAFGTIVSRRSGKTLTFLTHLPNKYLEELSELYEAGTLKPVIDKVYPLEQTAAAIADLGAGRIKGKAVIKII